MILGRAGFGLPLVAAFLAYLLAPGKFKWMDIELPLWLRWFGLILGLQSLIFLAWVHWALGDNFSPSIRVKRDHKLVMSGPYSLLRHPMYSAYFLLFVSAFLVSKNWVIGASGVAVILHLMLVRIRSEEALLIGRFGDAYHSYKEKTPRYMPRLLKRKNFSPIAPPSPESKHETRKIVYPSLEVPSSNLPSSTD